ncbi:MAG: L,D-transpeptidase family protein [Bacteroidota bacterium]|jgi:hypothetical protein
MDILSHFPLRKFILVAIVTHLASPLTMPLAAQPHASQPHASQPLLQRLKSKHEAFWNDAFGTTQWRNSAFAFVVVKKTEMLYVVRQGTGRDTIASFPICAMETSPGFKERQGDGRTPDGIYKISLLNPGSSYHLSMKINYPNAVDNARHARLTRLRGERWSQGGDIFIHGRCVTVGCIAMTDDVIEKLYLLVASLPADRRSIPVMVLPFDDEAHYQQMFFHADKQLGITHDPYWLLLREHIDNMRTLWRSFRGTGRVPVPVPTVEGLYTLPAIDD